MVVSERVSGASAGTGEAGNGSVETLATVRVPASSANLGPGFDVLAVALDLPLVVHARPYDGRRVVATGEGSHDVPDDEQNLIWRSVRAFCDVHQTAVPEITLHCDNAIPLARGLGSSSAAAVAGMALARALSGAPVSDQELIDLATTFEGHADNAAAAVLGGLVVAGPTGAARRFEPSRGLRPIVCIPEERSSTDETRALLPRTLPLETVVGTIRRTAVVLAGMTGVGAWDPSAMVDEVHEPARLEVMAGSRALLGIARDAGYGACLSGAGPSLLVITQGDVDEAVQHLRNATGASWRIEPLRWDLAGAHTVVHG